MMVLGFDILFRNNTVWDIWDMFGLCSTGKTPYVGIVGGMVRKTTVCGMVRWRYGTMVRCRGHIILLNTVCMW